MKPKYTLKLPFQYQEVHKNTNVWVLLTGDQELIKLLIIYNAYVSLQTRAHQVTDRAPKMIFIRHDLYKTAPQKSCFYVLPNDCTLFQLKPEEVIPA